MPYRPWFIAQNTSFVKKLKDIIKKYEDERSNGFMRHLDNPFIRGKEEGIREAIKFF